MNIAARSNLFYCLYLRWRTFNCSRINHAHLDELVSHGARCCDIGTVARRLRERKNHEICHIIGSGWSLRRSIQKIDPANSCIIGFNYASLANLPFDCFFAEFAGEKNLKTSLIQHELIVKHVKRRCDHIYFKNISDPKNDLKTQLRLYKGLAEFVPDIVYDAFSAQNLPLACSYLLRKPSDHLRQYASSIVGLIGLANLAGYSKICLHGVDLSGPYFFEDDPVVCEQVMGGVYVRRPLGASHPTNLGATGLGAAIPLLRDELERKNIALLCGTDESPISKLLGVI